MKLVKIETGWFRGLQPAVLASSVVTIAALVLFALLGRDWMSLDDFASFVLEGAGWWYAALTNVSLVFILWVGLGPLGKTRLGRDEDSPDFTFFEWIGMLFTAGMGIGLVFYAVDEPAKAYLAMRTPGTEADAASWAIRRSFFHWGLHAWALYACVGASLAYFCGRLGLPLSIRSSLYPLLGNRILGPAGHAADSLAVVATTIGMATSLGLGALQLTALTRDFVPEPVVAYLPLLVVIGVTAVATWSSVLGLKRGIRRLSNLNFLLAFAFLLVVGAAYPGTRTIEHLMQGAGEYLAHLPSLGGWRDVWEPGGPDGASVSDAYWAWWLAWSPFVGLFMARISIGRTLREFVLGALLVPTAAAMLWFAVLGAGAVELMQHEPSLASQLSSANTEQATILHVRAVFELVGLPLIGGAMVAVVGLLVLMFFISSSDSATYSNVMMLSVGDRDPLPRHHITWGLIEGGVAAVLLMAPSGSHALDALRAASVVAALPFSIIFVLMIAGFAYSLARGDSMRVNENTNPLEGGQPSGSDA